MDRNSDRTRDAELDGLVRRALEPTPATVEHIVTRALHGEAAATAPRPWRVAPRLSAALAAATVVLLCVVGITVWWSGPRPAPTARGTMSNEGDVIVIIAPDRPITLIGSGSAAPTAPPGTASIVLLGVPQ